MGATVTALAGVVACGDVQCSDGIVGCRGCNGWGWVNPKGKRYRVACREIPAWAVPCQACGGRCLVACGCRELTEDETAELAAIPPRGRYVAADNVAAVA